MNYIPKVNKYVNDLLLNGKNPISTSYNNKYINLELYIDKKQNDSIIFEINRNFSKKSYFHFKNGCPCGKFKIYDDMKKNILNLLIRRK